MSVQLTKEESGAARHGSGMDGPQALLSPPPLRRPVQTPSSAESGRGLRQLSLPTVGATQAAADAAAAARRVESHSSPAGDASEPLDAQRTRYFRRLSAMPPVVNVDPVPPPILKFMDAARGVLFALSQIYNALKQHISVSNDERLVAHFQRVLSLAGISMNMLISALDRLDTATQFGVPEPPVIRGVLDACSESLRTFRRAVSMLHAQLPQLEESVDVRFSRTLLLMLYGSVAELRNSAAIMAPHVEEVAPYLAQDVAEESDVPWRSRSRSRPPASDASFETMDTTSDSAFSPVASTPLPKHRTLRTKLSSSMMRSPASPVHTRKALASPRTTGTPSSSSSVPQLKMRSPPSVREVPVIDVTLQSLLEQVTAQAVQVWTDLHAHIHTHSPELSAAEETNAKRLRDVDEMCTSTLDQTRRLQATLASLPDDAWRARPPSPECQQLWEEANHFVRVRRSTNPGHYTHLDTDQGCRCTLSLPPRPDARRRRAEPGLLRPRRAAPQQCSPCVDHVIVTVVASHFHPGMEAEAKASSRAGDAEEDVPMSEEEGESLMKDSGNLVGMDSSDDDEDEEDEEEQRRVAEGFIVDEDEEGGDASHKRKRRHRRREAEDEELDEDDLALLQENQGPAPGVGPHKRARPDGDQERDADLAHIFDDEEEDEALPSVAGAIRDSMDQARGDYDDDELDDFIEDDEDDELQGLDEEAREERRRERREERRRARLSGARVDPLKVGIDPEAWDEIHDIFGNGEDYAWALGEEEEEEEAKKGKMEYKDVRRTTDPDL